MTMIGQDGTGKQRQDNSMGRRVGWAAPLTVSALLLSAALAGGCGSTNSVTAGNDAGTTTPDAAPIGTIVRGTSQPCTEPHSICVNATIPAAMMGQATMLQIDLYS